MNQWQLPGELENLERRLSARPSRQPGVQLRQRISDAVHAQLRRERYKENWSFAIAAALVVCVWINLSISAARQTDFHLRLACEHPPIEQTVRQIRELLPEMSESDARHEAMLLCAGANLAMYPRISIPPAAMKQMLNSDGLLPSPKGRGD